MVFFPQTWIELWEYTEKDDIPTFFGETSTEYQYVGRFFGDFQNSSPNDNPEEYGKILEDTFKIYFDVDVPVTDTMKIRKEGEKDTYTIKGSPQQYNTLIPHIKVTIQKDRKPTPLGENIK